tara:strand:- start:3129 stop:3335 length:207 start_codon:yes stop_codon:yes gene_type:complete
MAVYPAAFFKHYAEDGKFGRHERDERNFEARDELISTQKILGLNPQGSYSTVSERIAAATGESATWSS